MRNEVLFNNDLFYNVNKIIETVEVAMKSEILIKVKNAILKIEPSAEIILYGSRAREDFHEGSDWDFLILVDGEVDDKRNGMDPAKRPFVPRKQGNGQTQ